ncbi:hypothetical protein AB0B56_37665 [Streptosporangium canum]|uniref:hypothetical protein n=1 Tax=Streptosporangium canum TaxID=324952 RepID=UPI00342CF5BA
MARPIENDLRLAQVQQRRFDMPGELLRINRAERQWLGLGLVEAGQFDHQRRDGPQHAFGEVLT